jgi:hypothetical protein
MYWRTSSNRHRSGRSVRSSHGVTTFWAPQGKAISATKMARRRAVGSVLEVPASLPVWMVAHYVG